MFGILLPLLLGLSAVYLLLPRPRPYPTLWGGAAGGLAILLAGALWLDYGKVRAETILFYAFSAIAVTAGSLLVTQRNPARAALSFALVVLSTCGLFLLQAAPFLMAATIIVYAGAIIVTFLFVLMLAQQQGLSDADNRSREPLLACMAGFAMLGALLFLLFRSHDTQDLDDLLARIRDAQQQTTVDDIAGVLDDEQYFDDLIKSIEQLHLNPELTAGISNEIEQISVEDWWSHKRLPAKEAVAALKKDLQKVHQLGVRARAQLGDLPPDRDVPLSAWAGPPANQNTKRNARGVSALPADNVEAMGKALFTDHLLAVELGGTLLLVATIGAIVIAARKERVEQPKSES